ncbi:hypothetical protein [Leadbetterella byssophila]|uniref:hypothetical protein n=1 Tax=Leadbetterella byssophila TaxID=316068 RepID=UPI0039A3AF2C
MNSNRIREIQQKTAYPNSISVYQALMQVWNECKSKENKEFPSDQDIWDWWEMQNFQKEEGEQGYTMIFKIDLPKILKSFFDYFVINANGKKT